MDANELTRATCMLWQEKSPLEYVAVDKVHGISFILSYSLYTLSGATVGAIGAKETDIFGVTGLQDRVMRTLDTMFNVYYAPGTFNIKALRQFIAQMRKKSKIPPKHIETAVRERMYFHKDFLRIKEILPIFEFYKVVQSYNTVPFKEAKSPIYMQQYALKASQESCIESKANGNSNFHFAFTTDRKLVFTEFLDRMMEFEQGTFSNRKASNYSISYNITVSPDLSELIDFAESRLGKLFSTYYFDLVEK